MYNKSETNIQKWLAGKSVLVTGGTGFMGKVLLEKLLRSIPDLDKLYVIVRSKRGLNPQDRLEKIVQLPIFQKLCDETPGVLKKLIFLEGNVTEDRLGLSDDSLRKIENEVSVVFHMAALLRLEAEIKDSVTVNTLGTKRVMDLCKRIKKIESVVHLSTAFCHCDVRPLEEETYQPLKNPHEVIRLVSTESNEKLQKIKEALITPHPNSYIFSKRLSETIVEEYEKYLPVVITRPSIVLPTFREPIPGWVDSLNGPVGVLVACGKGVLRSMLCRGDNNAEIVPVDCAINGLIFAAYYRRMLKDKRVLVVNLSAPREEISITWNEVLERSRKVIHKYPFEWTLWYPAGAPTTNVFQHWLVVILFQWIPAIFLDCVFFIIGKERFMIRVQKKIMVGVDLLKYFTLNQWEVKTEKSKIAYEKYMFGGDREIFQLRNFEYDIDEFMVNSLLGARLYCLKENPSSLKYTRIHFQVLKILHYACVFLFCCFILKLLLKSIGFNYIM